MLQAKQSIECVVYSPFTQQTVLVQAGSSSAVVRTLVGLKHSVDLGDVKCCLVSKHLPYVSG